MTRAVEVAGNLERERAAGREVAEPARREPVVAVDPVQEHVADEHVHRRRRSPGRRIVASEAEVRCGLFAPRSIIAGDESKPTTSASGQRCASTAVRLPGPQPASTSRRGASARTCAIRSKNGRARALKYPTVAAAPAGMLQAGSLPGAGAHFINYSGVNINADGSVNPGNPASYIYDGISPTSRLVGVMYTSLASGDAPPGFPGPNDHCAHAHRRRDRRDGPGQRARRRARPRCRAPISTLHRPHRTRSDVPLRSGRVGERACRRSRNTLVPLERDVSRERIDRDPAGKFLDRFRGERRACRLDVRTRRRSPDAATTRVPTDGASRRRRRRRRVAVATAASGSRAVPRSDPPHARRHPARARLVVRGEPLAQRARQVHAGSRGRPSTFSPRMLRWTSLVPPPIVSARA